MQNIGSNGTISKAELGLMTNMYHGQIATVKEEFSDKIELYVWVVKDNIESWCKLPDTEKYIEITKEDIANILLGGKVLTMYENTYIRLKEK